MATHRQDDHEFETRLHYIVRHCLNKNRKKEDRYGSEANKQKRRVTGEEHVLNKHESLGSIPSTI